MCIRQPFFMSLCTPKLPRIIVSKGNHMSQDTIIRRSPIRGSGRICKFYPFPGSPPRRELRAATHPKRATKTAFRKCKRRIERHFWGTLPLRFPVRPPTAPLFIFIACESLFGCRVVFARTDHLQGFFQNFIASGMQTFDRGMYRYIDPHTRRAGVRIVRIINSETEST